VVSMKVVGLQLVQVREWVSMKVVGLHWCR